MIISHKFKLIFLANPKTGSTSIHNAIRLLDDPELIVKMDILDGKHLDCVELNNKYPYLKDYFKFSIVRNPWDLMVSYFFFYHKVLKKPISKKKVKKQFRDFLKWKIGNDSCNWGNRVTPQCKDQTQFTACCDFVGRFEYLQESFDEVCNRVGAKSVKLGHLNKTDHKHYSHYYDKKSIKIVEDEYKSDVILFNYKYGE